MNYDQYKLASPYDEDAFCEVCGDKLTKYEEVICEHCEENREEESEEE